VLIWSEVGVAQEEEEEEEEEPPDVVLAEKHVLFGMEETARGAKAVVEADAARINQDEKCRTFILLICGSGSGAKQ
jgi:hypothetical protein